MSELLPSLQALDVRRGLLDYLTTTFALADADAQEALRSFLGDPVDGMFKGPYLRLRMPFRPADPGWQHHVGWDLHFTPYGHQAQAFARLDSSGADGPLPTLITTGTGSGKTEAFLVPILDHARRARRDGVAGIKALVLYPMNALANDQAARLARQLTTREELAGITAALYTGQHDGPERTMVTSDGLITDRAVMRSDPPDILLTNYKMLDQLLLRHEDQPLWRASATSLRYLVLDEFHTYDGAQGTDVAMLLRRLGLALRNAWADDDPELTPEVRARPLGLITPVATSATLGDRGDPEVMRDFAATVFGQKFDDASVITEARLGHDEWAGSAVAEVSDAGLTALPVDQFDAHAILASLYALAPGATPEAATLVVLAGLYDITPDVLRERTGALSEGLLTLVKAHPLTRMLAEHTEQAIDVADLAARLFGDVPASTGAGDRAGERERFLVEVFAAFSHARATAGRAALSTEVHLWVRELTRIDRLASDSATYLWGDDGTLAPGSPDDPYGWEGRPAFPAVYCRHCGRSGWGVGLAPTGLDLDANDAVIRRNHVAREGRFRALLYARTEADHSAGASASGRHVARPDGAGDDAEVEGLRWFAVRHRTLLATPPADDDEDLRDGWVLPVLMLTGPDADDDSRADRCPSCQRPDGIRFLGSAIATLLSVTMSTLFGARELDSREKKALVFTDSVQDAAHRAAFVETRSHTLTLRSVLREAVGDEPITLDELAEEVVRGAGDDPFARYRLLAPDLVDREEFRPFWQARTARAVPPAVRKRVRRRVLFDATLEFGLQSRVGRTLEQTGSVAVEVDAGTGTRLAAIARRVLTSTDTQDTLDGSLAGVGDARLVAWVRGVLEHLRDGGAVAHEWFDPYIADDGARYRIWGGRPRHQGMPAFPGARPGHSGRAAPAFPRIGPALPGGQDPLLEAVTSSQSWHARWAARLLGVSPQHGAALARRLLEHLASESVLRSFTTRSKATVYAIPAGGVVITPTTVEALAAGDHLLTCTVCHNQFPGTATVADQLDKAPCLLVRCPGQLRRTPRHDNYYRRRYGTGAMRRIVAREHSSLLDDATRLAFESGFKRGQDDPHAPNVLVATPTLEMGIDIGDLSTVMLASLPRSVAAYLQRIGRAGRLTGNALDLAFVTGRGEHLPRLGDPLSVINGQVRPPATYLDAEEILQRQYVAHLVDAFAREPHRPHPRFARGALGSAEPGSFLGDLVAHAETDAPRLLEVFLTSFTGTLTETTRQGLRSWATPIDGPGTSGLAAHLYAASQRWTATVAEVEHRRAAIEAALPDLHARASLPAATDDDRRGERSALAALHLAKSQLKHLRGQYWIQVLEEFGVLPNYTLLDDGVTLDVALSWIDPDTQEFRSEPASYRRSAANALREFAPGAVFYARGTEITVDAVDLGVDAEAIRTWAFCPACGYCQDLEATGTTTAVATCPRCGGKGIADTRQHLDVVELTRVSAELRRDEAAIGDRRDERRREHFALFIAADLDPDAVTTRWYVEGYDFGAAYLKRLTVRWVNAGRESGFGPTRTIAGEERCAGLFRVCTGCGRLDSHSRVNRPQEHRPWCRYRTNRDEHIRPIALTRTLATQGVVLRLPRSVTLGDQFAVPSLSAALMLGLREQLGGSPDHIQVAQIHEPAPASGPGETADALLLHDVVPGGTGYLAELADPARVHGILYRAWTLVRDCPCRDEPRLACHRCLLPLAPPWQVDLVSREAAERHLRALLTSGRSAGEGEEPGPEPTWVLSETAPQNIDAESHLEQHFRAVFTERLGALGATVKQLPGPHGNRLVVTFPNAARHWTLDPQVLVGTCKPDFVLHCSDQNVPRIAIFTDGWRYHAAPACNRLADDAEKRAGLRDAGYLVVALAAADLHDSRTNAAPEPSWLRRDVIAALLASGRFSFSPQTVDVAAGGPLSFLLAWIQNPDRSAHEGFADALPWLFAPGARQLHLEPGADLARCAAGYLTGETTVDTAGTSPSGAAPSDPAPSSTASGDGGCVAWWWQAGVVGLLARHVAVSAQPAETPAATNGSGWVEVALVLDDQPDALAKDAHRAAWATWLSIANALAPRKQTTTVTTVSALAATASEAGTPVTGTTGAPEKGPEREPDAAGYPPGVDATSADDRSLGTAWRDALALAASDEERALLQALAGVEGLPVPVVGHETADGIPVDLTWPDRAIAVYLHPDETDCQDLTAAGWTVLAADVDTLATALLPDDALRLDERTS